ncbi:MAG: GWxTD domain-containing protein [Acidobacteriota bacterium]
MSHAFASALRLCACRVLLSSAVGLCAASLPAAASVVGQQVTTASTESQSAVRQATRLSAKLASTQQATAEKPHQLPLAPRHRKWLEEEVVYIITDTERDAFLDLSTDALRDGFIDTFWRVRDPTVGTQRNEFRDEHYRRIQYANRFLGRETPRKGWQTDRGRTYIQLGEPGEMQHYTDPKAFWPIELWFYRVNPQATDLPPFFYAMFFRPEFGREYRLYDPLTDGPEALAKQISLQIAPAGEIVQHLLETVGHEVAIASVNLDPGERVDFQNPSPSPGNAILLRNMQAVPYKGVDTSYAKTFAFNRGKTEATVVFNPIPVQMSALGFWDPRGLPFLHYVVQLDPEQVRLGEYEGDYYLSLEVGLKVTDPRGREIFTGSDNLERHFDDKKARALIRKPLVYFDRLDLVPGLYNLSVSLRNPITHEVGVANGRVLVPGGKAEEWMLSDLLLASAAVTLSAAQRQEGPRAFRFGNQQFLPLVRNRVAAGRELVLFSQLVRPASSVEDLQLHLGASLLDAQGEQLQTFYVSSPPVAPSPRPTPLQVHIPLQQVEPGEYQVRLLVELPGGRTLTRQSHLTVVGPDQLLAPEILLAGEAMPGGLSEYRVRGIEHLRKQERAAAEAYFRTGLQRDPSAADLRRLLGRVLVEQGGGKEAATVLRPLAERQDASAADLLLLSRALRQAGAPEEAVQLSRTVLERWPPTADAYNELAQGLVALGNRDEAAQAFRASLELDAEQPEVQQALARLTKSGS